MHLMPPVARVPNVLYINFILVHILKVHLMPPVARVPKRKAREAETEPQRTPHQASGLQFEEEEGQEPRCSIGGLSGCHESACEV